VAFFKIRRSHLHRGIRGNDNRGNVGKNVKLRRVRVTIAGMEKNILLHFITACLQP